MSLVSGPDLLLFLAAGMTSKFQHWFTVVLMDAHLSYVVLKGKRSSISRNSAVERIWSTFLPPC